MSYASTPNDSIILSDENVKKYVLPEYGLGYGEITGIKFKDTDKQRAVYKIEFENKSYCLKKVYYSLEDLLFIYSVVEWLYRFNIKVPRILPTLNGDRYYNYNNMLFILTPWIDGTKCSYDNITHVIDSAANLGRIHKTGQHFNSIEGSSKRECFEDLYLSTNKHLQHLLIAHNNAINYNDKFSKIFLENFDSSLCLAEEALSISTTINKKNLFKSICHLDYVNKNIIFDAEENIWTIDFDKCKVDYCFHDISYFLRRLLKRDNTRWDMEVAKNSLNAYERIRQLSYDEYMAILSYLSFPQRYWKISRDYYNNINKCNKNAFCTLLKKSVEKNEYQLQFVKEFKEYINEKF